MHDQAVGYEDTNWDEIVAIYGLLERMTDNPMVTLNRAVATGMSQGPEAGLALLDDLEARLADHHRLHGARAHLLEMAGDRDGAIAGVRVRRGRDHEPAREVLPDLPGGAARRRGQRLIVRSVDEAPKVGPGMGRGPRHGGGMRSTYAQARRSSSPTSPPLMTTWVRTSPSSSSTA